MRKDSTSRTPPKTSKRQILTVKSVERMQEYTLMQGLVVNSANLLQDAFFSLFQVAISLERHEAAASGGTIRFHDHASAVWNVIQSDSLQRAMAIAAISSVPTKLKLAKALLGLEWANRAAIRLTEYRNILAHNSIVFGRTSTNAWVPIIGGSGTRPAHRRRIKMMQGIASWRRLATDLFSLSRYVDTVTKQIQNIDIMTRDPTFGIRVSWPRRPRLRSLPQILALDRKLSQEAPRPKRRIRRRPSRK
jgi:hypothetical protein